MKKLFKWLLGLLGALAIIIAVLIYNPGLIRGQVEDYLGEITGYSIHLAGELSISVGRELALTATDIRISNPQWVNGGNLVELGALNLAVDSSSLFEDVIRIESLQISDLNIKLQTDSDGAGNWLVLQTEEATESVDEEAKAVIFKKVSLSNSSIHYQDGETGDTHSLHIDTFNQHLSDAGMLQIRLDGTYNQRPVEFDGSIGPYANLLQGRDIRITGNGHVGSLNIVVDGLIDNLLEPKRPSFNLDLQGPDIDEITAMIGIDDLGSGGFSLNARGEEIDGHYEAGIHGNIGDVSLHVSARASGLLQMDDVELELTASGPSLGSVTRAFGIDYWPGKPFSLNGKVQRIGGTLNVSALTLNIGGTQLTLDALLSNFPHLDASRVRLSLHGDNIEQFRELLGISGIATGPFEIHGQLDVSNEGVELVQITVNTALGQASLSGTLGPAPAYIGSKLNLHLDGHNAKLFMSAFDVDVLPAQAFNLDSRIELVEDGMLIEHGVLVTINDDRLELGGRVAFKPGGEGTDIEFRLSGDDLPEMLQRVLGDVQIPNKPYDLGGRVRLRENGIELQDVTMEFDGVRLTVEGIVMTDNALKGSELDFEISGDDLSSLKNFPDIGDSVDIFVAGQPYRAMGRFAIEDGGWRLEKITGKIGETAFEIDGLVSSRPEWVGSNIRFSVNGPGFYRLLNDNDESDLPLGAFSTTGAVELSGDHLTLKGFVFESERVNGKIDLQIGWPFSTSGDVRFDLDIRGDDVRHVIPQTEAFDPALASYTVKATVQRKGDLVSIQQFEASIGDLLVSLQGKVDDDPKDENVELSIRVSSSDLSSLGRLNGDPLPAMALDFKADLSGNAKYFVVENFTVTMGESRISGTLDVSLQGLIPRINLTAHSAYLDIRPLQAALNSGDEASVGADKDRMIPEMPLPLAVFAAADITLILSVDEIRHQKESIKNLSLDAVLNAGQLDIRHLEFEGQRGKFKSSFSITPTSAEAADVKIDFSAEKLILNLTGKELNWLDQAPSIDIEFHVSGNGRGLREIAGSLNGSLLLGSAGGTLEGVNLGLLDTFILKEIFNLIMPKSTSQDDYLDLRCAAAIMNFTDGKMKTAPALAFTTDKISIISKGTLDLKTEEIKLNFNAIPNNALKISAIELFNPYILVEGTLSKPSIGLDPAKVLLHGSVAIGTAGISILAKGLLDRVGNTVPVCQDMLQKVLEHQND